MQRYSGTLRSVALAAGCLVVGAGGAAAQATAGHEAHHAQGGPEQEIVALFTAYDAAFTAKDLNKLATMYHPDVTVYEGGGINPGWADYRDRHLGPELKSFNGLQFSHNNVKVQLLGAEAAYVTADYSLTRTVDDRPVTSGGLATYVVIRQDGRWIIRHSHTSARRRPAGGDGI
ncbi:MAG: SgcJ/EcaC family oxidoreductase [Vicinamibacterales bacterium]